VLNNEMDDFSTPGLVNLYGVPASPSNFIAPGKHPMSSMAPSIIVDRNGDAQLVIGGAGGTKITSSVAYAIIRHLYLNESISSAVGALRLHHQLAPMVIEHEENFDEAILMELVKRGHVLRAIPKDNGFAALQAIARENDGSLTSVNDHRRGGSAVVFTTHVEEGDAKKK
jgi:gamma-glutamyltranspeptidase / glutathione hydrolase / leukotriene-C4 hydrolase